MIKVLFVCHGNICRSPMAEFVFRDMVKKAGLGDCISVASAAVTTEEIGNDIHHGTRRKLQQEGIAFEPRAARLITRQDYEVFDYVILMDEENRCHLRRMFGDKIAQSTPLLLSFAGEERDIADPWYTGNFDVTYDDIVRGCTALLAQIRERHSF